MVYTNGVPCGLPRKTLQTSLKTVNIIPIWSMQAEFDINKITHKIFSKRSKALIRNGILCQETGFVVWSVNCTTESGSAALDDSPRLEPALNCTFYRPEDKPCVSISRSQQKGNVPLHVKSLSPSYTTKENKLYRARLPLIRKCQFND